MVTDLKSIHVLEFTVKITNWEGWSAKFLSRGKRLGYKKLLMGKEKIPTEREYTKAVVNKDQPTVKCVELSEPAYEDIFLSINHTSGQGKVAFSLVKNCVSDEYPEGNFKLAWDRLVAKYAPKTAPSLLKLKKAHQKGLGKETASLAFEKDEEKFDELYIDENGL